MAFDIRPLTEQDIPAMLDTTALVFGVNPVPETRETWRTLVPFDRFVCAWDGETLIGTGVSLDSSLSVPGGAVLPMAAVSAVSVRPTHRRRGALNQIMGSLVDQAVARGESLSALWASEALIYGRYGYGVATWHYHAGIDSDALRWPESGDLDDVSLSEVGDAEDDYKAICARVAHRRAGLHLRSEAWWRARILDDPEYRRGGGTALRVLRTHRRGRLTGLATFRHPNTFSLDGAEPVRIVEMYADDDQARETMWRFMTSIDLYPKVEWHLMPVDDPLPHLVGNHRVIDRKVEDGLWVRILDVEAALAARTYERDIDVVLDVRDSFRSALGGVFRLTVRDGVGSCVRSDDSADVSLGIVELSSLYLGGASAVQLAAAGRVVGEPATVLALHQGFHTATAPACQEVF
ncbi:enhanced intracellular survival protein [bacterium BMS3Bbin02]|nr:enhanced intracellular survival protein [bacterium BMS3Bbin02]